MPEMPTTYPFRNKQEDPDDAYHGNDEDPFKQRGTYTKEMKAHDQHMAWEDTHPVIENGEKRPWDDLNDFKAAKDKVERAKKIAQDIYEYAHKKIAPKAEKTAMKQSIREMKSSYRKSIEFMQRVRKKAKADDRRTKRLMRKEESRARQEQQQPKKTMGNKMISDMRAEDDAVVKSLDHQQPAAWAIDSVMKDGADPKISPDPSQKYLNPAFTRPRSNP